MSNERLTLRVDGMTCEGCENSIKTALERLDGVQVLDASHAEGTVEVLFDDERSGRDALVEAVEEAGYEVAGV